MDINKVIIDTARKYIGQKEIPPNQGFIDTKFQELMEIVGWEKGFAWCALFAELVWKEAYSQRDSSMISVVDKLFSAGSVQTFVNFRNAKWEISDVPQLGALAIWQTFRNGKFEWTGHTAIVSEFNVGTKMMKTIDGNTSDRNTREGDLVAEVSSSYVKDRGTLRLRGFVYPKQV